MKGKLWEMALDELLVKNVLLGRGCCKGAGEPSFLVCRVAFSGGLLLGGTWPSLKEAHLHWCAYCYWFLFMVFKQLMQVLTAFPFSYLHKRFYFGKISEDQWSGAPGERSRVKAGLGVASTKHLRGWGPGRGAKNICHWDTRNCCGPGQLNHSLGRSGYRAGGLQEGICLGNCAHTTLIMSTSDAWPYVALGFYFLCSRWEGQCSVPITEGCSLWPPKVLLLMFLQWFTWILDAQADSWACSMQPCWRWRLFRVDQSDSVSSVNTRPVRHVTR